MFSGDVLASFKIFARPRVVTHGFRLDVFDVRVPTSALLSRTAHSVTPKWLMMSFLFLHVREAVSSFFGFCMLPSA